MNTETEKNPAVAPSDLTDVLAAAVDKVGENTVVFILLCLIDKADGQSKDYVDGLGVWHDREIDGG